jgi:nucleoside-diphosphate-sugar epimerase
MARRLVLTGANGYVGTALCRAALAQGVELVILGKAPDLGGDARLTAYPWRLGEPAPEAALKGASAFIHVAHAWPADAAGPGPDNPNFSGTLLLAAQARAAGIARFVFVSTTAAHDGALNTYGKVKLATEAQLLKREPGLVLIGRLGLVYGGKPHGLFGLLSKLVTVFPALPMIGGQTRLQPVHVDETAEGLLLIATIAQPDRERYVLARPDTVTFAGWLGLLRRVNTGKRLFLLPIPLGAALALCDLTRFVPLFPTISRERVYGLVAARPMPSAEDLQALGLQLREPRQGLLRAPRSGRRRLIAESRALLRYLGTDARRGVRALVRACERNDGGDPLYLSGLLLRCPALLRWVDPLPRRPGVPLARRLEMALAWQAVAAPVARPVFAALLLQSVWEALALPARLLSGLLRR